MHKKMAQNKAILMSFTTVKKLGPKHQKNSDQN